MVDEVVDFCQFFFWDGLEFLQDLLNQHGSEIGTDVGLSVFRMAYEFVLWKGAIVFDR